MNALSGAKRLLEIDEINFLKNSRNFFIRDLFSRCMEYNITDKKLKILLNDIIFYQKTYCTECVIKTNELFILIEILIQRGNFQNFFEETIQIIKLDPEVFFLTDISGYNIFMMIIEQQYLVDNEYDEYYPFIYRLFNILNSYRMFLLKSKDLRISWNIENISSEILNKNYDIDHIDDSETILSLVIKTRSIKLIELFFFKGCFRIYFEDSYTPPESCELFNKVLNNYIDENKIFIGYQGSTVIRTINKKIFNFELKVKFMLTIECFRENGIYLDTFELYQDIINLIGFEDSGEHCYGNFYHQNNNDADADADADAEE
jgi:hypothetical protein